MYYHTYLLDECGRRREAFSALIFLYFSCPLNALLKNKANTVGLVANLGVFRLRHSSSFFFPRESTNKTNEISLHCCITQNPLLRSSVCSMYGFQFNFHFILDNEKNYYKNDLDFFSAFIVPTR